ncbi:LOW QUALITY PROTEIN: Retrovirus Polyprotein [Phytophthora megakarya]|uniref:Retrovirus Polyprotein n=1 Tax=Phytophthora megakarya TaxID=4795 RepID=A0A225V9B0_9STRA|nr:LOW QUALITY PROTEIN: Retrovirus Polyprotein [Phytophthora megakarya]
MLAEMELTLILPKILREWQLSGTRSELQSFLGTAVYVQRIFQNFANDASPLFDILKWHKKKKVEWTEELRNYFECLKTNISSRPVLAIQNFDRQFHLRMDASDFAVGGVLFQEDGEGQASVERPVAFGGRKYKDAEKHYSIREKKLLAIMVYLLDKPYIVETDHRSLEMIFTQKTISRRVAR